MAVDDAPSSAQLQRENARLQAELVEARAALTQARGREAEGLARETATSEILRVISSSPTDLQSVLDAVAEHAARLCAASGVTIHRFDGRAFRRTAVYGDLPSAPIGEERPLSRSLVAGRAFID